MRFCFWRDPKKQVTKYYCLSASLFLSACTTVGPEYSQPEVSLPATWSQYDEQIDRRTIDREWWKGFDDPVLDTFVLLAEKENLSLRQAILRIIESRSILGLTKVNNLPNTQLNGNASTTSQSEHASPQPLHNDELYNLGFDTSWEIDVWGKLLRQRESAEASHMSVVANYGDVLISVTAEVISNYISIRTTQQRISLLKESIALQERSLQIAEVWYENGGRTELDLQQARALVFETQSQLPSLEQELYKLESAMATLLGTHRRSIVAKLHVSSGIPQFNDQHQIGLPVDMLRRRPDIRAAEYLAKVQTAELGVSEADFYPSFSLTGSLGYSVATGVPTLAGGSLGSSASDLLTGKAFQYSVGGGFSWNIFSFGRIENNLRAADARLQQAIESYKSTVISAVKETEDSLISLQKSKQQEELLAKSARAYGRATSLSLKQYKDGATDYQSVLDSLRQLVNVRQTHVQAKGQISLNLVSVYRAIGGGWSINTPVILPDKTVDEMKQRTNWENSLAQ